MNRYHALKVDWNNVSPADFGKLAEFTIKFPAEIYTHKMIAYVEQNDYDETILDLPAGVEFTNLRLYIEIPPTAEKPENFIAESNDKTTWLLWIDEFNWSEYDRENIVKSYDIEKYKQDEIDI